MKELPSRLAVGLVTLMAAPALRAQEQPARSWQLQIDFGLVNTAGNTSGFKRTDRFLTSGLQIVF